MTKRRSDGTIGLVLRVSIMRTVPGVATADSRT
ncbi:hypothetical protein C8J36_107156 [Rhizobium sp. PP-F2F-G48]|nr:hypothetical protein C8J36_107156 [Rhizobium sp. PP-F2F-G48]